MYNDLKWFSVLFVSVLMTTVGWCACAVMGAVPQPGGRPTIEHGSFIVHVGCGDGVSTAALRVGEHQVVQGLTTHREMVGQARENIQAMGLYGDVSVRYWDGGRLPYADNMTNVLLVDAPDEVEPAEIERVVAPGGTAYIRNDDRWRKTVKQRPQDMGEWLHWQHGPDANAVSQDRLVGPPKHLQWVAPPRWQTHHDMVPSITAMVTAGGRVFYIVNETAVGVRGLPDKWRLVARDAFNGVTLWKRKVPE